MQRLPGAIEAFRIMRARSRTSHEGRFGELLSMGVLEAFRGTRFNRESGLNISRDLVQRGVDRLRERGTRKVIAVMDTENRAVQLMYHSMGWRISETVPGGWRVPQLKLHISLDDEIVR